MAESPKTHVEALIVGAGFSGIGTAVMLDRAGLGDYLIVEAGDGAGGTWYWNTYPGIAVDIPSFSYQFSFEQSPNWSRTYAPGRELRAYAEHCVAIYGLAQRIRFNTTVREARFDDNDNLWRVYTNGGEITARYLIHASGVLTVPSFADVEGVDSFGGITMHTARWDHGQNLTGKRLGIIGTPSSTERHLVQIARALTAQVELIDGLDVFVGRACFSYQGDSFVARGLWRDLVRRRSSKAVDERRSSDSWGASNLTRSPHRRRPCPLSGQGLRFRFQNWLI